MPNPPGQHSQHPNSDVGVLFWGPAATKLTSVLPFVPFYGHCLCNRQPVRFLSSTQKWSWGPKLETKGLIAPHSKFRLFPEVGAYHHPSWCVWKVLVQDQPYISLHAPHPRTKEGLAEASAYNAMSIQRSHHPLLSEAEVAAGRAKESLIKYTKMRLAPYILARKIFASLQSQVLPGSTSRIKRLKNILEPHSYYGDAG